MCLHLNLLDFKSRDPSQALFPHCNVHGCPFSTCKYYSFPSVFTVLLRHQLHSYNFQKHPRFFHFCRHSTVTESVTLSPYLCFLLWPILSRPDRCCSASQTCIISCTLMSISILPMSPLKPLHNLFYKIQACSHNSSLLCMKI